MLLIMPDSVLYIHSSYKYFSVWLRQHNYALYRKLLNVCTSKKLWWNFEETLAWVDRDYMLSAGEIMLPDSWDEDKDSIADLQITSVLIGPCQIKDTNNYPILVDRIFNVFGDHFIVNPSQCSLG